MPIYEYACRECTNRFDLLRTLSDPPPECPECGSEQPTRLISVISGLTGSGRPAVSAGGGCGCGGTCACGR